MSIARNKKSISNKLSGQIGRGQHFVKAIPTGVNKFLSAKLEEKNAENLLRYVSVSVFILKERNICINHFPL